MPRSGRRAAVQRPPDPRARAVALALAVLTLLVFLRTAGNGFIGFDDRAYVVDNFHVNSGLSLGGLRWAFTSVGYASNWHPLTWLSHMLDVSLFGLDPAGHHLMSSLLHAANAALLFLVLRAFTGALWPSAAAAALFAVHPLHVESVAWIAERKDVLSTLFWLLAMAAHLRQASRPSAGRRLQVALLMGLGLLAKPMLVTLPLVLLVLDWWPLGRLRARPGEWTRAVAEKAPLLALSAASAAMTLAAQARSWSLGSTALFPPAARLANALTAAAGYLLKAVWPTGLAVFYPHRRGDVPWAPAVWAILLLAGLSLLAWRQRRRRPWLAAGWIWYLVTLAPVSGLIQVGQQSMADRYTYVPLTGPFVAVCWAAAEAAGRRPRRRAAAAALAAAVVAALAVASFVQAGLWRNDLTLFGHTLRVTRDNYVAEFLYGLALRKRGDLDGAIAHYRAAVRLEPAFPDAANNLRFALLEKARLEKEAAALREGPGGP